MYYPRLRDLREDHDLTQKEVAAALGIDQRVYSTYETGRREIPAHHAVALADYLASYRAGYAVMVRYGNSVYSAFLCYNNYIFNSDRTVA